MTMLHDVTDAKTTHRLPWHAATYLRAQVLCDALSGASPDLGGFVRSPPESLRWSSRKWRILEEILRFDADIITLCEVDHYDDWVAPMLATVGYRGCFVKKPASPTLQYGDLEDGCAILYRADKVEVLNSHSLVYAIADTPGAPRKICNQVAIMALLRLKTDAEGAAGGDGASGGYKHFVLATTHLKADKSAEGEAVRAQQARQLLAEVGKFRDRAAAGLGLASAEALPVIVTGDMNATPHASADYGALCYAELSTSALRLRSAYPLAGDDAFTTWKIRPCKDGSGGMRETRHTIDYVLYAGEGCEAVARVAMPTAQECGESRVPSFMYPSDHFSLVVDFKI
ncbi:Endonuclease/exonuclease/phosphatase [Tribonema minus]|uniref:Endonuclease/exonuclease/phosphatase n=1 Tax=Tribonema minus TaxID=303371 RepID=A0A835YLL9_9STRA|nr:Endonuclease/exonuclease/phosphatase [Tribonema minus]